ncbi:MAG TPA: discoidin domain-containing protein, partial [Polyangia bacterium]|nr:discoidin domain-containing protein [Polyangia bacterium]
MTQAAQEVAPEGISEEASAPRKRGRVRAVLLSPVTLVRKLRSGVWGSAEVVRLRKLDLLPTLSDRQRADLRQALAVRRLAAETMAAADPQRAGALLPALIGILRNGTFWALSAATPEPAPADLVEAFDRLPADVLQALVPDAAVRERLRTVLTVSGESWGRRERSEQEQGLGDLETLSTAMLTRLTNSARRLRGIFVRRLVLSFAMLVLVVAGVKVGLSLDLRPSLTTGQPWRASSTLEVCHPQEHSCADAVTNIFFHTLEEESPWVEFDLGSRKAFTRLTVKNRSDCCPDRAVPLIFEVSDDRVTWREVVRRTETFSTWKASFPTTRA